jgi:hypothetical protein
MTSVQKYRLRFFIEWGPPAYLWAGDDYTRATFGFGPIQDKLPLSDTLRQRGDELADWFQDSLNWSNPLGPRLWRQEECDRFKDAVRAFFVDLKTELRENYELVYQQDEPEEDPALDE